MKTRSNRTQYVTKKTDLGRLARKKNAFKKEIKRRKPPTRGNQQRLALMEAAINVACSDENDKSDNSISASTSNLLSTISGIPTRVQTRRQVRESSITCLMYGTNRVSKYPDYYFCANCQMFEDRITFKSAPFVGIKENSPKYRCTAGHKDPMHPTVTKNEKSYCRIKNNLEKSVMNESNDWANNTIGNIINKPSKLNIYTGSSTKYQDNKNDSDCDISFATLQKQMREIESKNSALSHQLSSLKAKYQLCEQLKLHKDELNNDIITKLEEENGSLKRQIELFDKLKFDFQVTKKLHREEQKVNQRLKSRITTLNKNLNNHKLESLIPHNIALDDFFSLLIPCFNKVSSKKNRSHNNMSDRFVEFIWNATFLSGCMRSSIIEYTKKYFRETIFSPARILELLDMNGGQLSYQGIDLLRELETNGEKYVTNTIIPHSSSVKRVCGVVDKYASIIVPFKMGKLKKGSEYAEFQPEDVLPLIYKGYQVEDTAKKRNICIDQSIDAAQITSRQNVTVWGVKMVDAAARDPKTGNILIGYNDTSTVQSRNHCFPLKIALERENNEVFEQFRPNMEALQRLTNVPLNEYKPIKCAMDCDLSATWKLLSMGGAFRNKTFGCHLCAEPKDFVGQHYGEPCNEWCKKLHKNNPNVKCRHSPIFSPENVAIMQDKLNIIKDILGDLKDNMSFLKENSYIKWNEDPRGMTDIQSAYDIESIHYDLTIDANDKQSKDLYSMNITNDLRLRQLDITGSTNVRQQRLKKSLINEWTYRHLTASTEYYFKNEHERLLSIIDCVPCILHMENRCGIKILHMLLTEGLNNAGEKKIFKSLRTSKERIKEFIKTVEDIANKEILGNEDYPACWHVPFVKDEIDNITLDNNRTRALMYNLESLIDLCLCDDNKKNKFKQCIGHYRSLFTLLRKKEDFSDEEIDEFQTYSDYFYNDWIDIYGAAGVTNYIHMIGSGHVADFLKHYRNLYIHSQQGWEHFNSFLKVYFFRRTMRGGGASNGSKIKPLARWFGRRMVWMSGTKYSYMKQIVKENTIETMFSIDDVRTNDENDSTNIHEDDGIEVDKLLSFL